jgi:hypothetical protein
MKKNIFIANKTKRISGKAVAIKKELALSAGVTRVVPPRGVTG